jgi:DnaJ-domain-containing protein 1
LGAGLRPGQKPPPGWKGGFRVNDPLDLGANTAFDKRQRERAEADRRRSKPGAAADEDRALKVLELSHPFTMETLQRRYKALAKRHHPDANGGSIEAETKMKLINAAYRTLKAIVAA